MRYPVTLVLMAGLCLALECSRDNFFAAGSSVSGNARVSGLLSKKDGTPASHTRVSLVPSSFVPLVNPQQSNVMTILADTTDDEGRYVFPSAPQDTYSVEAKGLVDGARLLIEHVAVKTDSVNVGVSVMQKPGAIKIVLPAGIDSINGYVYIPGTDIFAALGNRGDSAVLDSVPAATGIAVDYAVSGSASLPNMLAENISVVPESTVIMVYSAWLYNEKIYFNTTASGADVNGTVVNFPILIRLNLTDFNFAQAQSNGNDIRFANSNNVSLPYEIERWDATGGQAEIWVKIDTILGNSSSQYVVFYWGNAKAASASNGAAVFDTANGFQGVWHMAWAGNTPAVDATSNHFDGTPYSMTAASSVQGYIGMARQFDGQTDYIAMPGTAAGALDFPKNAVYSVSAWVSADTLDGRYRIIASKGNKQYNLQIKNTDEWEFAEFRDAPQDSVGWEETTTPAATGAWTYVVGMRVGTMQYLYVNGSCVDSSIALFPLKASDSLRQRDQTNNFTIGKLPDSPSYFFTGIIDEVRVSNKELSRDWIKLCYMNQKADNSLITFK
jgi:Concanavalin A-like lectin/glucanases superfamily/Domain of unknown function (DUF2341)